MNSRLQQRYKQNVIGGSVLFLTLVMLVAIYFYTSHVQRLITEKERSVASLYISWIDLKEELYQSSYGPSSYYDLLTKLSGFEMVMQETFLSAKLSGAKLRFPEFRDTYHALYIKWPYVDRELHTLINDLVKAENQRFPSLFSPTLLMESFEKDLLLLDETVRSYSLEQLNKFQLFNNLILTTLVLMVLGFLMYIISTHQKHMAEDRIRMLTQSLLRVQEDERKQIAYDLHDDIVQDLASLKMKVDNMMAAYSNEEGITNKELLPLSKTMQEIIQTTRRITGEIKPYNIEHIGLVSAVRTLCNNLSAQTGIQVRFFPVGMNTLQSDYTTEINLYRIAQESLQNIRKHSEATKVSVRLIASSPNILMRINDNGKGFNPSSRFIQMSHEEVHLGLTSMEERAHMLKGELSINSAPGRGTEIKVKVPMQYQSLL